MTIEPAEEDAPEEKAVADDNSTSLTTRILPLSRYDSDSSSAMEIDSKSKPSAARVGKKGIVKKRSKKSKIVFPKYGDRAGKNKKGGK